MDLQLGKLLAADLILNQAVPQTLYKFRNRERSLMSLFWTSYSNLEAGKHTLLVVDNKEDLEFINYQISKNRLSDLCLILNDIETLESNYWIAKFRDDDQRKQALKSQFKDHDLAGASLEDLLTEMNLNASKLRIPQLGSMSLVQVNDKIAFGTPTDLDTSAQILQPPYDYGVYRAKKEMFLEAEKLYDERFDHLKTQDPFLRTSLLALGAEEIQIKLTDASSKIAALLKRYEAIDKAVFSNFEAGNNGGIENIKKELSVLKGMHYSHLELSETDLIKQTHQQKLLFEALGITADPPSVPSELEMGMARIEEAVAEVVIAQYSKAQKLSTAYLDRLTPSNTDYPEVADLIHDTNFLMEEVRELEILVETLDQRSVAFSYQKQNLESLQKRIAYAQYFLSDNQAYIDWLAFEQHLTEEDLTIVSYLSKQNQFWGDGFEKIFLAYYVNHSKSMLDSVQNQNEQLDDLLRAYTRLRHVGLVRDNFSFTGTIDINSESWETFLDKSGEQIMQRYPLLVVDSDFYNKYSERMVNALDNIIFLNNIPNKVYKEEWLENTFLGYDPTFVTQIKNGHPALIDCEQIEDPLQSCNINRNFKNLSIAELNRAARYLGQEMAAANSNFKIYQTREISFISFWSDAKNAHLLKHFEGYGVKEIVSDSEGINLIPGLLADTTKQNYVLVEDNLFTVSSEIGLVRQHMLLANLKTAGVTVLSLDNHQMITKGKEPFNKILNVLKKASKLNKPVMV